MGIEIELKLRIDPKFIKLLYSSAVLTRYSQGEALKQPLVSTYFDTPEYDLRRNGYSLRIRKIDDELLQTVKAKGTRVGDLHQREEWDQEINSLNPDLTLIEDAELRAKLEKIVSGKSLLPLFTTEFTRTSWQLILPDTTHLELALDEGKIKTATKQDLINEIELELISGDADKIAEIAAQLQETLSLEVEHQSKAERGFLLYRDV